MESKKLVNSKNLTICSFDANLLLRWLLNDNIEQAGLVQNILDNPTLKKVDIADITIAECVWVMQSVYKMTREQIAEGLEIVLTYPKFMLNKTLFREILPTFVQNTQVSLVDLMLQQYAGCNGGPLLTSDRKLASASSNVLLIS